MHTQKYALPPAQFITYFQVYIQAGFRRREADRAVRRQRTDWAEFDKGAAGKAACTGSPTCLNYGLRSVKIPHRPQTAEALNVTLPLN